VSSNSGPIGHLNRTSRLFCSAVGIGQLVVVDAGKSSARHITSSTSHLSPRQAGRFFPDMTGARTPKNQILIW
jgi:hypothetical protein